MNDKKRKLPKSFGKEVTYAFLKGIKAHILKAGIENARMKIFQTQLTKYGGISCDEFSEDITHLVVDENVEMMRIISLLKIEEVSENIDIVKTNWLSKCFKEKSLVDISEYLVKRNTPKPKLEASENDSKSSTADVKNREEATHQPGPSSDKNDMHVSKRRKLAYSDSDNSSDYDSDTGGKLERQVSVPSTEKMLKVVLSCMFKFIPVLLSLYQ